MFINEGDLDFGIDEKLQQIHLFKPSRDCPTEAFHYAGNSSLGTNENNP
jgi:hypothetical protein